MSNRVFMAYYSRKGHTKALALEVCLGLRTSGVEVACEELVPERKLGLLQVGARSIAHTTEPIMECNADLGNVNLLALGTPVWGGSPAPYLRSLLVQVEDLIGLPVMLFATCAYGDRNAAHYLREMVRERGGRPLDYRVWRIRRDGATGLQRTADEVVDSALSLLPTRGVDAGA